MDQYIGVEVLAALRAGRPSGRVAVPGLSLRVDHRSELRPDVAVIRRDDAEAGSVSVREAVLVVDILPAVWRFRDMYAKAKVYAAAGVGHYWVIDPLHDEGIVLSQFQPGPHGDYEIVASTKDVFVTEVPYPVTLDLPALTARRKAIMERARPAE